MKRVRLGFAFCGLLKTATRIGDWGLRTADYQLPTVDWRLLDADWPTAVRHVGVEWANLRPPVVSAEC